MNETDRLSRLVGQLLDLSRIETGLVALRREPVSIDSLARTVVDEMIPRAQAAAIALSIDAPEKFLARADPDQIRQVFINLIGNALKFTPTGGRVDVRVYREKTLTGRLPPGKWVVASVMDSGAGIASEDLPHIFERFYRSDKSRVRDSEQSEGTGLGLAIVKSIIDAHRGRIWVDSQIGKGSVFTFILPMDLT